VISARSQARAEANEREDIAIAARRYDDGVHQRRRTFGLVVGGSLGERLGCREFLLARSTPATTTMGNPAPTNAIASPDAINETIEAMLLRLLRSVC
jgi:hypothetical protein